MSHATPTATEPSARSTVVNAVIGAVASIVLAFLPFSPVLGGAVAGYLERSQNDTQSLKVGAISGLMAAIPIIVGFGLLLGSVAIAATVGGEPVSGALFAVIVAVVVLFSLVFIVGFSAVGGLLGGVIYRREGARGGEREQSTSPATTTGGVDANDAVPRL